MSSQTVLVVHMEDGNIQTISREHRQVYTSVTGDYIKTRADGVIYLQDGDVAIISYRRVPYSLPGGGTRYVRRLVDEPVEEVMDNVQLMLWQFGLDKTPRTVVE